MRLCFLIALILGPWLTGARPARAADGPHVVRDTLLLKDPEGPHLSEAYRYYTEPFTVAPDPEQVEAR